VFKRKPWKKVESELMERFGGQWEGHVTGKRKIKRKASAPAEYLQQGTRRGGLPPGEREERKK